MICLKRGLTSQFKMSFCAFCEKSLGPTRFQRGGHLSSCVQYQLVKDRVILEERQYGPRRPDHLPVPPTPRYDFEDILPELLFANDEFLRRQRLVASVDIMNAFKACLLYTSPSPRDS